MFSSLPVCGGEESGIVVSGAPHLAGIEVRSADFPCDDCYPFNIPALQGCALEFTDPVTFFVGENGSGKSTLLEAVARACDIHIWGTSKKYIAHHNPYETSLGQYVRVAWVERRVAGGLFSAETFRDRADFLDDVSLVDPGQLKYFGGRTITDQSHGQGMMTFFRGRYQIPGLYFLDEPEAALSPATQLELCHLLGTLRGQRHAQFIVATHSPILLGLPDAQILSFEPDDIVERAYDQTAHYRLYRDFMADPAAYLQSLAPADAGSAEPGGHLGGGPGDASTGATVTTMREDDR
jgi:predicted ATPase